MSERTKILVVDDDPIELRILTTALRATEQYEVLAAGNATDALQLALQERPPLIVSDYLMPDVNGFAFCTMVKRHPDLGGTIFMICSATGDIGSKTEGLNLGADDYLTKPVDFEEMFLRVRALLRLKSLQDELADDKKILENLNRELQDDFDGIISLLMKVMALRVPAAVARAGLASAMCEWIAGRFEMDATMARAIALAGRLREIGKINLPDEILRKSPAEYTPPERSRSEQYPVLGQLLLSDIPPLKDVALLLRHQNENYDGTGYPDRLSGTGIPLGSRILRAVNLAQELMEGREGSRSAIPESIMESLGTLLDPRVGLLIEEYMRVVIDPSWKEGKRPVRLEELKEGMVIASDLITGRGIMLLSKDSPLTQSQIDHLASMSHFDPIIHEIYVYDRPAHAA